MVEDFNLNKNILGCMQKTRASSRMMWLLSRPRRRPPTGALVPIAFWIGSPTMHSYRDGSLESSRTRNFPSDCFLYFHDFSFRKCRISLPHLFVLLCARSWCYQAKIVAKMQIHLCIIHSTVPLSFIPFGKLQFPYTRSRNIRHPFECLFSIRFSLFCH